MRNKITKWEPLDELQDIRDYFDQTFSSRFSPFKRMLKRGIWSPTIDLYDQKDRLVIKVELPGIKKEDVKITVEEDTLTIKGECKKEEEVSEKDYYFQERAYGSFSRTITLPASVEKDKVHAAYKDGIMTIDIPKSKEAQTHEVEVEVE